MSHYSLSAKIIHFISAVLITSLTILGLYMVSVEDKKLMIFLFDTHKSLGILVLVTLVIRIISKLKSEKVYKLDGHSSVEDILSSVIQKTFYSLLFIVPISGWLMTNAAGFTVSMFGLIELPSLSIESEALMTVYRGIHFYSTAIFTFLIAIHVIGALKHHFIDKDETLQRMFSHKVGTLGGVTIAVLTGMFLFFSVELWISGLGESSTTHEKAHDTSHQSAH
ncbi:cytochrome b [Vibrio sp. F74]|uniref:cytochrome b n=1 Tax=Vibrio sp. F74 TaxID=700020 RepID=UPI0035F57EE2